MRTNWVSLGLFVGCIGAAFAGCGGNDDTSGGGGGGSATPIPLDNLPAALSAAMCGIITDCLGDLYSLYMPGQDCTTVNQAQFEDGDFANIKQGISDGTVVYDGTKAQACLDAISAAGCSLLTSRMPAVCKEAVAGTVTNGGDCTFNAECKEVNAYCKIDATCPGKCSPLEMSGTACTTSDQCQTGLVCGENTKKCEAPVAAAGACSDSGAQCVAGLLCKRDSNTATSGTCSEMSQMFIAGIGETCDLQGGLYCQTGLACILDSINTSTNPPTAVMKCAAKVASGAPCRYSFPDQCPTDEYCSGVDLNTVKFDGTCSKLPTVGQTCTEGAILGGGCASALVCDANKVCKEIHRLDGTCGGASECYSNTCAGGKCAVKSDCPAQ